MGRTELLHWNNVDQPASSDQSSQSYTPSQILLTGIHCQLEKHLQKPSAHVFLCEQVVSSSSFSAWLLLSHTPLSGRHSLASINGQKIVIEKCQYILFYHKRAVQSAIVSRVFRAVLPGRIFILSGSKALQAPSAVPVHHPVHPTAFYPAETSFYAARGDQQFPVVLPCCSRRGILTG